MVMFDQTPPSQQEIAEWLNKLWDAFYRGERDGILDCFYPPEEYPGQSADDQDDLACFYGVFTDSGGGKFDVFSGSGGV